MYVIICDEVVDIAFTLSVAGLINDNGTRGGGPGGVYLWHDVIDLPPPLYAAHIVSCGCRISPSLVRVPYPHAVG